jgi:hypothetical protein
MFRHGRGTAAMRSESLWLGDIIVEGDDIFGDGVDAQK